MKTVDAGQTTLDACIKDSQDQRVLITQDGKPVALVLGIGDLDRDQLQLAGSQKFWTFIEERRKQKALSRSELEQKIERATTSKKN